MYGQPIYNALEPWLMRKFVGQRWMQSHSVAAINEGADVSASGKALPRGEKVKATKHIIVPSILLMLLTRNLYAASIGCISILFPFFSYIMGLIGAIGLTPLTYLLPLWMWVVANKEMSQASKVFHLGLAGAFLGAGTLAAIGAVRGIVVSFDTFTFA